MAQDSSRTTEQNFARNSVYVELLGQGLLYSFNYDRRFTEHIGARIGISFFTIFDARSVFVPVTGYYLVGLGSSGSHHVELGAGFVFGSLSGDKKDDDESGFLDLEYTGSETVIFGTATLGYRYQPAGGGFLFRIGVTPFFIFGGDEDDEDERWFLPWVGASIGYSF